MRRLKLFLCYLNNLYLFKNPYKALLFAKGCSEWKPLRKICFKIIEGQIISFDGRSKFNISHLKSFNYSVNNLQNALERFFFSENDSGIIFSPISNPEVQFILGQYDNINAANEIFHDHLYNISVNKPSIVFDVGVNVGLSAIYFSNLPWVKKVIGYEPFPRTYAMALKNTALNQNVQSKIELYNFGISDTTKVVLVPEAEGGFMGASTTDFFLDEQKKYLKLPDKSVQLELREAAIQFKEEMFKYSDYEYVLKLDCEGAEYEIVRSLMEFDVLKKFTAIIIEWHFKGPEEILTALTHQGFYYIELPRYTSTPMGMIYAFRQ